MRVVEVEPSALIALPGRYTTVLFLRAFKCCIGVTILHVYVLITYFLGQMRTIMRTRFLRDAPLEPLERPTPELRLPMLWF